MRPESVCETAFSRGGPFWHLYTDGGAMEIIFTCAEDYVFGITLLGICAAVFPHCRILTFSLMSNHLHIILAGPHPDVMALFALFKSRLGAYLKRKGYFCRMDRFVAETFQIPSLQALRNEIVYVNRNGYLVQPDCTPFSYWWSAGVYFFNPTGLMLPTKPYSALTLREQRALCHCRDASLPDRYRVLTGFNVDKSSASMSMLFPPSFCAISEAEAYFRDAHQYFRRLGRDNEAYAEVARRLGDRIFLTDDELFGAVCNLSAREFGSPKPGLLTGDQKLEVARRMHFDYNASPKQIQRILKLAPAIVDTLFPRSAAT